MGRHEVFGLAHGEVCGLVFSVFGRVGCPYLCVALCYSYCLIICFGCLFICSSVYLLVCSSLVMLYILSIYSSSNLLICSIYLFLLSYVALLVSLSAPTLLCSPARLFFYPVPLSICSSVYPFHPSIHLVHSLLNGSVIIQKLCV